MDKRDAERRDFMIKKQVLTQKEALRKREKTERKIEQARMAAEMALHKQREDFM